MTISTVAGASVSMAAIGYVCGSVPFGFLIGRLNGVDVRRHGSRNIGATNVVRVLGRRWGYTCFALDFLKGLAPVLLSLHVCRAKGDLELLEWVPVLTAAGAIAGHVWPCWLSFKGGKGVATSIGALVPLVLWPVLIAVAAWGVVFGVSRYVSLASLCATVLLPVSAAILTHFRVIAPPAPLHLLLAAVAVLIVVRHRDNIRRLLAGTENRFGSGTKARSAAEGINAAATPGAVPETKERN